MLDKIIDNYPNIIVIALITIIAHVILRFVLQKLVHLSLKTHNTFDDVLVGSFTPPLKLFLWLIFGYIILNQLMLERWSIYLDIVVAINIMWLLIRIIGAIENYFINESDKFDNDLVRLMTRLVKLIVVIMIGLSVMQYFGVAISSILTFGGVGGMVIGFAAKDMLANIFGGLMISLDKPFSVGDWVRVGEVEGTVEQIGWRMTVVRTFSKNPVYVPNSMFATKSIETPSRMSNRRIYEKIGVRYEDMSVLNHLINDIETMLKTHTEIDQKALTMVYFNHFNDSSLELVVYTFTQTTNWVKFQQVKGKILLKIADIINHHKAEFAYPTQTLHIQK